MEKLYFSGEFPNNRYKKIVDEKTNLKDIIPEFKVYRAIKDRNKDFATTLDEWITIKTGAKASGPEGRFLAGL